jgi:DNA-binding NarL/FixJ family response regulator
MAQESIRLLIVDDHPLFRQGVRLFLRETPGIELAGEAGSGEDALRFLENDTVDVVMPNSFDLTGC